VSSARFPRTFPDHTDAFAVIFAGAVKYSPTMFVRRGRLKVQRWDETSRVMPSSLPVKDAFALYHAGTQGKLAERRRVAD
jgi:hypothetical protein